MAFPSIVNFAGRDEARSRSTADAQSDSGGDWHVLGSSSDGERRRRERKKRRNLFSSKGTERAMDGWREGKKKEGREVGKKERREGGK